MNFGSLSLSDTAMLGNRLKWIQARSARSVGLAILADAALSSASFGAEFGGGVAIEPTSPWTLWRIVVLTGGLTVAIIAAIVCMRMLRQRVERQTELIRRRLEREAMLEQRYRELIENAYDIIYTHDLDGNFTSINRAGEKITGYSVEDVAGMNIARLLPPDQLALARMMQQKRQDGRVTTYELEVLAKDGRRVTLEVSSRTLFEEGKPVGVQGVARDITSRKQAERAMRIQEEFIRNVIDADPNLIFVKDGDGRFTLVNRTLAEFHGLTVKELVGRRDVDLNPDAKQVEQFRRDDRQVLETGQDKFIAEERVTNQQGKGLWLQTFKRRVVAPDGKGYLVLGVATDITERKHREEQLEQTRSFLNSVIENLPIAVFMKEPVELRFVLWNKAGAALLGYSAEEMIGKNDYDFFPKEQADFFVAKDREALNGGKLVEIEEEELLTRDQNIRVMRTKKIPILDSAGRPICLLGICEDITDRKRAEAALRTSEERFQRVARATSDVIWDWDLITDRVWWNECLETTYGYRIEGWTTDSRWWLDRVHPDDRDGVSSSIKAAFATREFWSHEYRFARADGSYAFIHDRGHVMRDESGRCARMIGAMADITARKEGEVALRQAKETAESASRVKSEFLANMSHEIRTPMNAIIGMTGLLLETQLTDEQRDYVITVKHGADGLLALINDILDLSKMEAGKLSVEKLEFNLRETVELTLDLLAEDAFRKGIELASFIAEGIPAIVSGDGGRVRQVLLNLAGNAIKFTERGEVFVSVTREAESNGEVLVRIEVADTGIGISAETRQRLFQPFTQADGSTTRKFGGTGLGLAICKKLVHLMGGQIGVRSAAGRGSAFWVTLPFGTVPGLSAEEPALPHAFTTWRVLVADANESVRKPLQQYLTAWRVPNDGATNPDELFAALRRAHSGGSPYRVVLLGALGPALDPISLAQRVHAEPEFGQLQMVALVRWGPHHRSESLAASGISAVLTKPLKRGDLRECLLRLDNASSPDPSSELLTGGSGERNGQIRGGLRILLVEDNLFSQNVTLKELEKLGHTADAVSNGLEVLPALESKDYDLVLMDCQMPGLDGYEVTRQLRQNPRTRSLPIIAITANAMPGDREKCLEAGMDDYLSKPVALSDLARALDRWRQPHPATVNSV